MKQITEMETGIDFQPLVESLISLYPFICKASNNFDGECVILTFGLEITATIEQIAQIEEDINAFISSPEIVAIAKPEILDSSLYAKRAELVFWVIY